jgi:hypothetical protein
MATALDYSAGRPSGAAVKGAGHDGVIRYVGTPGRTKNITAAEYADMNQQGVGVALVYENHTGDAAGGYAAGQAAARAARADADSIGFPANRPIYFAIDSDQVTSAQFAAVMSYLDGAASVIGHQCVGVYGEFDVIEQAVPAHAAYGWQCAAWSKGKHSAKAALYQRIGTVTVGGIGCDVNDILATDWGQHNYNGPTSTHQEEEPMQVKAAADGVVYVPTYGRPGLYIQSGYGHNVTVTELTWIGPTPTAPQGGNYLGGEKNWTFHADRPGPAPVKPGAVVVAIRYSAEADFTAWCA